MQSSINYTCEGGDGSGCGLTPTDEDVFSALEIEEEEEILAKRSAPNFLVTITPTKQITNRTMNQKNTSKYMYVCM